MVGLVMAATGVAGLLDLIRGGPWLAIFALVVAIALFGLASYFTWGYFWLLKRPALRKKAMRDADAHQDLLKQPGE